MSGLVDFEASSSKRRAFAAVVSTALLAFLFHVKFRLRLNTLTKKMIMTIRLASPANGPITGIKLAREQKQIAIASDAPMSPDGMFSFSA